MKLLILTTVAAFEKDVLKLFKDSKIDAFSTSEIDGYKNNPNFIAMQSWFPATHNGNESLMFFTFTTDDKIKIFFKLAQKFNENITTSNRLRAVVVPIEKYI